MVVRLGRRPPSSLILTLIVTLSELAAWGQHLDTIGGGGSFADDGPPTAAAPTATVSAAAPRILYSFRFTGSARAGLESLHSGW